MELYSIKSKMSTFEVRGGGYPELNFGHDMFEMPIRHPCEYVKSSAVRPRGRASKREAGLDMYILYIITTQSFLPKSNKSLLYLRGKKQKQYIEIS